MKVFFIQKGSDHGEAIPLFKESPQEPSYSIFLFDGVGEPFSIRESKFQIVFGSDGVTFGINEFECEVSDDPKKRWEILGVILAIDIITIIFQGDMFCQIHYQRQILDGIFVDWPQRIIDETGTRQYCQRKYLCIVLRILFQRTNTFRVNHQYVYRLPIWCTPL